MKKVFLLIFALTALSAAAQRNLVQQQIAAQGERDPFAGDSIEKEDVPVGLYTWHIDPQFGTIIPAEPDTVAHGFQSLPFTSGPRGQYLFTGNLGAPRIARNFFDRTLLPNESDFMFETPYDFFLRNAGNLLFTNTKSPFANLTYHECGNKNNGEDLFRAMFATNVNKKLGFGFNIDYLYGRGYYANQSNSEFGATLFGSYVSDRYTLHAYIGSSHIKNTENGGLESDVYITHPEQQTTRYNTEDMPTKLSKTWNRMHMNTLYLTHRLNFGFNRYRNEAGHIVRVESTVPKILQDKAVANDSSVQPIATPADTLPPAARDSMATLRKPEPRKTEAAPTDSLKLEFIPVASLIHTMQLSDNSRRFLSNVRMNETNSTYFNDFYLPGDSADDNTTLFEISNTLALELNEGFNRWAKAGMRLFATHIFQRFAMPSLNNGKDHYNVNKIQLGAQLMKRQGKALHYSLSALTETDGSNWGNFFVNATADLNLRLGNDTLRVDLNGHIYNWGPSFYFTHYHARNAWWDNEDWKNTFSTRIGGAVSYKDWKLSAGVETLQNYVYFAEQQTQTTTAGGEALTLFGVAPRQTSKNLQIITAQLSHHLKLGILNWENELTYQMSSDKDILPLPALGVYSNLYLDFRIARVLHTELGAEAYYFTKFYGPTYSPLIGRYAVQDASNRVEMGNYPVVNAYVNFHLKHTRFYVMASHVNYSRGSGMPFLVPHYPLNDFVLRLGISWNFFN